jgi:hypothetical protein
VSFQKLSKLHESEGRVEFEVSEKLTSVCFFKLHEKPYLLITYMKKLCSHVRKSHLEIKKLRNLKNKKLRKFKKLRNNCTVFLFFAPYFIFCSVFQKHCAAVFMCIISVIILFLRKKTTKKSKTIVNMHIVRYI